MIGALLFTVPLVTLAIGNVMVWSNERAIDKMSDQAQLIARAERAERDSEALRDAVAPLLRKHSAAEILDGLATALPVEAFLMEANKVDNGKLRLRVSTEDPTNLRPIFASRAWSLHEVDEAPAGNDHIETTVEGRMR